MGTRKLLRKVLPKNLWGDRIYGRHIFRRRLGRYPENPPVKFNDHLFAFKTSGACYDPLVQFVTDKEYAKLYIAATIGEEYTVETYRILRNKKEIEEFNPERFPCILKPTHSSGQALIVFDLSTPLDRKMIGKWLNINFYERSREQNYRYLTPKIIAEEFFSKDGHTIPKDFKIFCVNGIPKFLQVDSDRHTSHKRNLYDTSWNRIFATLLYPAKQEDDPKPALLDEMIQAAQMLSAPFPFVRVDMYATETKLKIGELTFVPGAAGEPLNPPEAEYTLGAYFRDSDAEP